MIRLRTASLPLLLSLVGAAALSCATVPARATPSNYGDRAHAQYDAAMVLFRDSNLLEAGDAFRRLRREYGLSRWAWLAELRLADIDYKTDKFAEAIQGYRTWIRYHPTQPEVQYARYWIARCYFAQIPNDWALVPASWERDQSSTHDAEDALQRFIQDNPTSEYATEAAVYLRRTRELLARHEIMVAEFYLNRSHPEAAVIRLQGVVETYVGSGLEPEALVKLGEVYLLMNRRPEAAAAFHTVLDRYARSSFVPAARRYLAFIGPITPASSSPAPAPASTPTTATGTGTGTGG